MSLYLNERANLPNPEALRCIASYFHFRLSLSECDVMKSFDGGGSQTIDNFVH